MDNRGQGTSSIVALASTTDGGKTWQPLPLPSSSFNPTYTYEIASQIRGGIYFINPQDGWLFYGGLYSTHDGGLTWTYEPTDGTITQMDRAPDGTAWALEKRRGDWIVKQVTVAPYRQWLELISDFGVPLDMFSVTLADAKHAWVSHALPYQHELELLYTDDGGGTWRNLGTPCDSHSDGFIVAVDAHTLWYGCGSGGAGTWGSKLVLESSDGGITWAVKGEVPWPPQANGNLSLYGYLTGFGAVSPSFAYMNLGRAPNMIITRDGGTTWEYPYVGGCMGDVFQAQALFIDSQHGWAIDQTCIDRTVDGGKTWAVTELPDN